MKREIDPSGIVIDKLFSSQELKSHIKKKGLIIAQLLIITFIFFFSLPLLNSFFPTLMKYQISGSFNLGLLWVILQYPLGAAVAWYYAKKMVRYDNAEWVKHYLKNGKVK